MNEAKMIDGPGVERKMERMVDSFAANCEALQSAEARLWQLLARVRGEVPQTTADRPERSYSGGLLGDLEARTDTLGDIHGRMCEALGEIEQLL